MIDQASKDKILRYINEAEARDGASVLVDGRKWAEPGFKEGSGFWVGPTILKHKKLEGPIDVATVRERLDAAVKDEIFGPVLSVIEVDTFDEAIAIENSNPYGNAACIYTSIGQHSESVTYTYTSLGHCC